LERPEKPVQMDALVKPSTVASSLNSRFTKSNGKMWVKDRPSKERKRRINNEQDKSNMSRIE